MLLQRKGTSFENFSSKTCATATLGGALVGGKLPRGESPTSRKEGRSNPGKSPNRLQGGQSTPPDPMSGESHGARLTRTTRLEDTSPTRLEHTSLSRCQRVHLAGLPTREERTLINNSHRESFLDDVLTRELAVADRARKHKYH